MGKSSPKQPQAPDPMETARAQTSVNRDAALWNATLNNTNQITPFGSLTYSQTGGGPQYNMDAYNKAMEVWNATNGQGGGAAASPAPVSGFQAAADAFNRSNPAYANISGFSQGPGAAASSQGGGMPKLDDFKTGDLPPQFTSTITLDPAEQNLLDQQRNLNQRQNILAGDILPMARASLTQPLDFSGMPELFGGQSQSDAIARAEEAIMSRLNPRFASDEEALRTRLINQGIGQGSRAYDREFDGLNRARNDARMQAILGGQEYGDRAYNQSLSRRQQMINELMTQRRAPLDEYLALRNGTAPTMPQFQSSNYQGAQPADLQGNIMNNYNQSMNNYNAQVAGNNSMTGSILGLAGSLGGGFLGSKTGAKWLTGLFG